MRVYRPDDIPPPRPVHAIFTCDGDHGLFDAPELRLTLTFAEGERPAWDQAVKVGWSIVQDRDLCPECKRRRAVA